MERIVGPLPRPFSRLPITTRDVLQPVVVVADDGRGVTADFLITTTGSPGLCARSSSSFSRLDVSMPSATAITFFPCSDLSALPERAACVQLISDLNVFPNLS
jgi:hypothetical protein